MQLGNRKCETNFLQINKPFSHPDYALYKSNKFKYDNASILKIWT